ATGPFTGRRELRVTNAVGSEAGPFELRWAPIPESFALVAGSAVPPTPFDPAAVQRIAVTDADVAVGEGGDRIAGFGTGRSYPIERRGPPQVTRIAASCIVTGGAGALANRTGMFALSGLFTPPDDFQLNILVMIANPGALAATGELPGIAPLAGLPRNSTFLP